MLLSLLGILCGLAAVVLAAAAARPWALAACAAAAVVIVATLPVAAFLDSAAIGLLVTAMAALALWKPRAAFAIAACGGAAAGLWTATLSAQGWPLAPVAALAVLAPVAAALLTVRTQRFAPDPVRDEGLAMVALLGVLVAAAPVVGDGFRSAVALKAVPMTDEAAASSWALLVAAFCVLVGGLFTAWRNR